MILRLLAWWRKGQIVWLRDFQGRSYRTVARKDPWGELVAPVYASTNTGHVVLLPDGKIGAESESSYITAWIPETSPEAVAQATQDGGGA